MTAPSQDDDARRRDQAERDAVRRRRRAAVFGEALPEVTSDELDPEPGRDDTNDARLRGDVPPHHG